MIKVDFNFNMIKDISYQNFQIDNIRKISKNLKDNIKNITKNNIDYDSRYAVAVRELTYLEELLDTDENMDLTQYTLYMSLITDACNNIAHDCKNANQKREFFKIKELGIKNIESQIQENRNEMDIISGSYVDDTKLRGNGYVYVVDIPYVGQVSWHTSHKTQDRLEEMNIDPYPYKLEKEGRFVSEILMSTAKMDRKNMPHNYLIQMLPYGEENNLRAALDYYERNKRKIYDEKSRLQIVKELVDEKNFSPEMTENLKTVLQISDSEFSKAKKSYIEENEKDEIT